MELMYKKKYKILEYIHNSVTFYRKGQEAEALNETGTERGKTPGLPAFFPGVTV